MRSRTPLPTPSHAKRRFRATVGWSRKVQVARRAPAEDCEHEADAADGCHLLRALVRVVAAPSAGSGRGGAFSVANGLRVEADDPGDDSNREPSGAHASGQ